MDNLADKKVLLENKQAFFTLMSKILIEEPTIQLLDSLRMADIFEGTPFAEQQQDCLEGLRLLDAWTQDLKRGIDEEINDYNRLFGVLGTPLASPWESSYLGEVTGMVFQLETLEVRQWYRRFGMEVRKKNKEPDDNIAYELEFIAYLAGEALHALETGDRERCEILLQAEVDFLQEHLLKWGFTWCDRMIASSKTNLYVGIAKLIKGALHELADARGTMK